MFFSAVVPPGYIIYRFIRWYLKQDTLVADRIHKLLASLSKEQ